jgi:Fe-S-cluster containining protein
MDEVIKQLPAMAENKYKENKKYFSRLRRSPPKDLDKIMRTLHRDEFERTDCLKCANCCKTTGPLFTTSDIVRISRHMRLKPNRFIEKYLLVDEENDYVLRQLPCTFLRADNYCSIYDVRPKACREFPHTDRKKFHQITHLTMKNVAICPAAFNIVEEMKKRVKWR